MKYSEVNISPALAEKWLEKNIVNRSLRDYLVCSYARDMKEGKWLLNGEAIRFNKSGMLVDGQHRLSAIIRAGVTVKILVISEVDDNAAAIYDTGAKRNPADALRMWGCDPSLCNNQIIGMINLIRQTYMTKNNYKCTNSELKEIVDKYQDELRTVKSICVSRSGAVSVNSGIIMAGVFCAYMNGVDEDVLTSFTTILSNGFYEGAYQSAAIVLRNDIIQKKISFGGAQNRVDSLHAIEKAIYDFANRIPRKKSYAGCSIPIYSTFKL